MDMVFGFSDLENHGIDMRVDFLITTFPLLPSSSFFLVSKLCAVI